MKFSAVVLALAATSAQAFTVSQPSSKPMTVLNAEFEDTDAPTMSAVNEAPKLFGVGVPDFVANFFDTFTKKEGPITIEDVEKNSGLGETGAYLDDISDSGPLP